MDERERDERAKIADGRASEVDWSGLPFRVRHRLKAVIYRIEHREEIKARGRKRPVNGRYKRKDLKLKCQFCGILLVSKMVKPKRTRYCDKCKADPEVRRYLRNLYVRRCNQKKKGQVPDALVFAEDID